ncbi:MAG: hypothetical protein ABI670_16385 [Chloroflexota bacterium]
MSSRRLKLSCLFIIVICLFLLPAAAGAAPSGGPTAAGAASPEAAVTALVTPFYDPTAGNNACNAVTGQLQDCPVSDRLRQLLQNPVPALGSGNLVGRNQNPPGNVSVGLMDNDGQTAHVNTTWQYGANAYNIVFVVINQPDGWVVDDTYCGGLPSEQAQATSIYNSPVGPCQVINIGSGGVNPGMPSTGNAGSSTNVLLAALAALLLLAGSAWRIAGKSARSRK